MYSLLFFQFIRSRTVQIILTLVFMIGVASIIMGKQFLLKQESIIAKVTEYQRKHIERNVVVTNEMGSLLYYLRFSLIEAPEKISALSIGTRDINPGIQSVTIRTLEAQKYDTDLNNPALMHSGNLDLGFVIIYLFPLVIISFMFNLISEEREGGTWRLVTIQTKSRIHLLLKKLIVRAVSVYFVLFILLALAAAMLSLPISQDLLAFVAVSILYLAFWFALTLLLVSFQWHSSVNALALLSAWIVLAILVPAAVNNYVASQFPVPQAFGAMVKQRDGYHNKWDLDKHVTMDKFYNHYPELKKYGIPQDAFSWTWYYAMQQMGDDESVAERTAMRQQIMHRERISRTLAYAFPTMHAQLSLNDIARTSLNDHLELLDQTGEFHERLRLHFYPRIFENAPVGSENWEEFTPEYVQYKKRVQWGSILGPLLISSAVALLMGLAFLRKQESILKQRSPTSPLSLP